MLIFGNSLCQAASRWYFGVRMKIFICTIVFFLSLLGGAAFFLGSNSFAADQDKLEAWPDASNPFPQGNGKLAEALAAAKALF